jgi:hypothetical protein
MSMGMPKARKTMEKMKKIMMVLVREGTGCQEGKICCLNCSRNVVCYCYRYGCMVIIIYVGWMGFIGYMGEIIMVERDIYDGF